ncbi:protein sorting system archaetidylserine synthase [Halomarina oriensis]|uniref:Phosphatidylcholine/phosphatidylserine synthase n=1 Tax=Halomarina oriensis TaxID=671145 RepID=A0A6B0GHU6_9EURY|nr:protein sorting system archaetidylserine synthase [Halomarina oriensis]MWG33371.1 phosphatidylcholine/phosphatidylserine synthase [Halomarina oriensis]
MRPRFVGRFGVADGMTVCNAAIGFAAAAAVLVDPGLAARLVLLAAVADGADGVLARKYGGTQFGEYLDSLADVASFSVAPALFVFGVAFEAWGETTGTLVAGGVAALFVAMGVVRLGLYTVHDPKKPVTVGVPTTLAATVLATLYLAGLTNPTALLGITAAFAYLMVVTVPYPDLLVRDALAMGAVQALAVFFPTAFSRAFPRLLLLAALAYLVLAPDLYWRDGDEDTTAGAESAREATDGGQTTTRR